METYPEMNQKIVSILELSNEPHILYAAQRIKELENKPRLGCATTEELINEIKARIEMDGKLGYRTVDA